MSTAPKERHKRGLRQLLLLLLIPVVLGLFCLVAFFAGNAIWARYPGPLDSRIVDVEWTRNGDLFHFCSLSDFPDTLVFHADGTYSGDGALWQGGRYQALARERMRMATARGWRVYKISFADFTSADQLYVHKGACNLSYSDLSSFDTAP